MANYRITILKGNDIGLEIVPVAVETVKTSVGRYSDIGIEWVELPIGYSSYRENGETLPKNY
jgi:3-isopropylmalate dehydrogenase